MKKVILFFCFLLLIFKSYGTDTITYKEVLLEIEGIGFYIEISNNVFDTIVRKTYVNEYIEITQNKEGIIRVKEYKHNVISSQKSYIIKKKRRSKHLTLRNPNTSEPIRKKVYYYKLKPVGIWIFHDEFGYIIRREEH